MAALTGQTVLRVGRTDVPRVIGAIAISRRYASDNVNINRGQTSNLAAYRRGRGGRSSFSGSVVTVLGSSGFSGRYIVNQLGKVGSQVICPYRGEPYFMRHLRLAGDLGQILFLEYNIRNEESLRKVMKYSNVVVNLVGSEWETKNFTFKDVNVDGCQRIARIANEMGVEKLIHFSHLNASPNPKPIFIKEGSEYLRSKYYGELAVREEYPDAIVFRPSDMYGCGDRYMNYYGSRWRRTNKGIPLWKKGTETIKMPIYVGDVARGVVNAISDPDAVGRTYEVTGPNGYQMSDMIDYFFNLMRFWDFKRKNISPLFQARVMALSNLPSYPMLNMEKLDREHQNDILTGLPTLEDLGVELTKLEDRAEWELKPWRKYQHYEEKLGEFPDALPPKAIV